jgi:hypothetical protein
MQISANRWGVSGWEATSSWTDGSCFTQSSGVNHIVYANNVANGCANGGFSLNGGDYDIVVGNIIYNAASTSAVCTSGITMWEPASSDTLAGTHMYVAGNFSYSNLNPNPCAGTAPTDGEGIIFDTFNHQPYCQQVVAQNNILLGNGGRGIEVNSNTCAAFYLKNNTAYGNDNQPGQLFPSGLGDITVNASDVTTTGNLAMTSAGTVGSNAIYAASLQGSSNTFSGNWLYSAAGNTTFGSGYGSNTTGTNPSFASTTIPGAPSCSGQANTVACAATLISNFTPMASGASAYGRQAVSGTSVTDPLFPTFLCSGNSLVSGFPSGVVTPGCGVAANTYPVPAGASTATIQSTINTAAAASSAATVSFAAGSYSITSTISIPCPASSLIITGPSIPYPGPGPFTGNGPYSATLNSSVTTATAFNLPSGCTKAITFENFNYNGGQPSGGGGGAFYGPTGGGSNLTITNNYFHGNWANTSGSHDYDSFIWLDAPEPGPGNYWTNVTITWNSFGAATDCNPVMNLFTYQGNSYISSGGYCAAVGLHASTNNLVVQNNAIYHQEQGMKFFEGGSAPTTFFATNDTINFNDFSNIHRIGIELQQDTTGDNFNFNSFHDQVYPGYGSFGFSLPSYPGQNANSNIFAGNVSAQCCGQGSSEYAPAALEFWGHGTANNNLFQNWTIRTTGGGCTGQCGSGILYGPVGPTGGTATFTFDIFQFPNAWNYIIGEDGGPAPIQNNNSQTTTLAALISTPPTIYPPSGSYTFPQTVTLTDVGSTSGLGPLGNTSVYYTTDGSTPVPRSGTTQLYTVPFNMAVAGTVKAVGMWGAANQPTTYPAGYGYLPSSVVSAAYTGSGGTPTAATPVMSPASEPFSGTLSVSVSDSTPSSTIYCTTDGTTPTTSSPVYTGAYGLTVATTINCIAAATGFLNSPVGTGTYTIAPPTLTGGFLSNAGSINTLKVGATAIQFTAVGTYSDSVNRNMPDSFGNTAVWSSSNTGILTVGSTGLVSCATAGTANVQVTSSPTSVVFFVWTMTCTATTPTAATPVVNPASKTFTGTQQVTISDSIAGSTIYYTTNGTAPTTSSAVYTGTFNVTATTTVQAIATAPNYNQSAVGSATYMLQAATITSAFLNIQGSNALNYITVGKTVHFIANVVYSDGVQLTSTAVGVLNARGDSISSWTTSASGIATISTSGILTAVALGKVQIQAIIDGATPSNPWFEYVSASSSTVTSGTTTKGVTIQ